jgi:hypothetical protein
MLNSGAWKGQFRRLMVGSAVIRIGWFASLDPAVLVATTEAGAADPTDTRRAPERLAAATANPGAENENAVFDNDGGRVSTSHPQRPQATVSTAARIDLAY